MNENIKAKCDLFVENRNLIHSNFKFDYDTTSVAAALIFTNADKTADIDKIKECRQILKKKASALSSYRNTIELILTSKMSLQEDPEKYIDNVIALTNKIRRSKLLDDSNEIIAAMNVIESGHLDEADAINEKYQEIMKRMRKEHPILTGSEDVPFAMMLALSDKGVDNIITEMEACYSYIKENFKTSKDAIQAMSEVLTLYDTGVDAKCKKTLDIYNSFKESGHKYGKYYEFASLGVLTNLNMDTSSLVSEIGEVAEYLHQHKGFGNWALGSETRLMFAAMMIAGIYCEDNGNLTGPTSGSTIAVIIAEAIALMMLIIMTNNIIIASSN